MGERSLELSRATLVRESTKEQLADQTYLEKLTMLLGLNNENLHEQPGFVEKFSGGLMMWQYPNQFSKYLSALKGFKISSYLEIGCRWGGTFVFTCEFLKKMCSMERAVAVDIIDSPVSKYCESETGKKFMRIDSLSEEFKRYIRGEFFDIIFIDGNYEYHAVKSDWEACRDRANILVFHDIVSDACPGVKSMWQEIKQSNSTGFEFYEMTDQYQEVLNRTGRRYLGIGVAIRRSFLERHRRELAEQSDPAARFWLRELQQSSSRGSRPRKHHGGRKIF